jgi:hypothetical protein
MAVVDAPRAEDTAARPVLDRKLVYVSGKGGTGCGSAPVVTVPCEFSTEIDRCELERLAERLVP